MRLWHQKLIHYLPRQQLLGQHRECCALRGAGWKKKHSTIDYIFKYDLGHLYMYHMFVMQEMKMRGYNVYDEWYYHRRYRGKSLPKDSLLHIGSFTCGPNDIVYPEHDDKYMKECLLNLKSKKVDLVNGKTIDEMLVELDLKLC